MTISYSKIKPYSRNWTSNSKHNTKLDKKNSYKYARHKLKFNQKILCDFDMKTDTFLKFNYEFHTKKLTRKI